MTLTSRFTDWAKREGTPIGTAQRVWTVTGQDLQVVRSEIDAGAVFETHCHPHEQIIVVVSGTHEFTIGTQTRKLGPGGVFHLPSGVPHGGRVVGTEVLVLLEAFHPPRLDYTDPREPTSHDAPR
jgi:quercetin dioxygenase-like cupin family protein